MENRISIVRILKGVPFSSSTKNTIDFTDIITQQNYFASKTVASFEDLSFIRGFYNKAIQVPINIERIRDCDYLMWGNPDYNEGNRWRYAFITGMRYVNDGNTEVYFKQDNYQTYMFNFNFTPCFVEREHTLNDLDLNVEEENIECNFGDYVPYETWDIDSYEEWEVGILYCPNSTRLKQTKRAVGTKTYNLQVRGYDSEEELVVSKGTLAVDDNSNVTETYVYDTDNYTAQGVMYGNYYTGAKLEEVDANASSVNAKLTTLVKAGNNIINMYMIPKKFKTNTSFKGSIECSLQPDIFAPLKNNKCKQYPFMFMRLYNQNGGSKDIHFELTGLLNYNLTESKARINYLILYNKMNVAEAKLMLEKYPQAFYGGATDVGDLSQGLYLANLPLCAWENNAYFNWIGNSRAEQQVAGRKAVDFYKRNEVGLATGADYATGGAITHPYISPKNDPYESTRYSIVGAAGALASGIEKAFVGIEDAFLGYGAGMAVQAFSKMSELGGAGGGATASLLNINNNLCGFLGVCYCSSNLLEIDKFFTRYGYATNKIKKPNLKGRANVNYVKTKNASIYGEMPNDAKIEIQNLFNNGLSIFHSEEALLNYADDNPIAI